MKNLSNKSCNKSVGENIRSIRHQKGWSQEDLASRLGISIPALSKIETALTDINLSRLEQIASVYQLPVSNLLKASVEAHTRQNTTLDNTEKNILDREVEITDLQRRLIFLYEQLRSVRNVSLKEAYI